jgi:hypothetical protein
MREKPTSDYIWLGTAVRYLLDVNPGVSLHGDGGVITNLEALFRDLPDLELHVTDRLAYTQGLDRLLEEFKQTEDGATLTAEQHGNLRPAMRTLRATVVAEASGVNAYVVSEKRFPTDKLIKRVGSLFPNGIFKRLPELTRYDFTEAGKCIAFERPTAAAFHTLRGTEGMLRDFYLATVKRNRLKVLNWKPMLDQLAARSQPPPQPLLDHLDHIREHFRNPTQHPETTYDIDEAQDLFSLCVDAATRLVRAHPDG